MPDSQLFSQRFGYGLHTLAYVAHKPSDHASTLDEVSNWMRGVRPGTSDMELAQVVQDMIAGRMLRSLADDSQKSCTRDSDSDSDSDFAFTLNIPAEQISLYDVLRLLDGTPGDTNPCNLANTTDCSITQFCLQKSPFAQSTQDFLTSLKALSIIDLVNDLFPQDKLSK